MNNSDLTPKQQKELFCTEQGKSKPWEQPGWNGLEDECGQYGYLPSLALGIGFAAAFGLFTLFHLGAVWWSKRWSLLILVAGGLIQIIGWVSRVISSDDPYADGPFIAQTTTLIIAPSLFSGALYILFGFIITYVGAQYSSLKPRTYGIVFISCDFISLILQGAGGGIAATADDSDGSKMGTNIMEAGIVFQLVATIVFSVLALLFRRNAKKDNALPMRFTNVWYLELAVAFGTAMIIIRGIYRTVELAQGWSGYLIEREPYILFDAIPMILLLAALALAHPGWTLPKNLAPRDGRKTISSEENIDLLSNKVVSKDGKGHFRRLRDINQESA